ncbi:hypothetical protein [Helicobacter typhlonius]
MLLQGIDINSLPYDLQKQFDTNNTLVCSSLIDSTFIKELIALESMQ